MNNDESIKEIIQDYRESRERIRTVIREYEEREYRLFKIMLDKINAISNRANSAEIYSEFESALE